MINPIVIDPTITPPEVPAAQPTDWEELVRRRLVVLNPLSAPAPELTAASQMAGYPSILDLGEGWGRGLTRGLHALEACELHQGIGVRVSMSEGQASWRADQLSAWVAQGVIHKVIVDESEDWGAWSALKAQAPHRDYHVWVEARTEAGARRAAEDSRISGVVLVSSEAAGACGTRSALVWLQSIERLGLGRLGVYSERKPFWVRGEMTISGITAALVAGADRVIIDEHLIGAAELTLSSAFEHIYQRLGREHSERRLVAQQSSELKRAPHLPQPEQRFARFLTWPQTFGWSVSQRPHDDHSALSASWGDDLRQQLVPLSSSWPNIRAIATDLQRVLPDKQPRCAEILREIARRVGKRLARANEHTAVLCPPQSLVTQLNIRYPIFQGPMTRVSDRPAFALSIAEDGALPFIALSLLTPEKARALLDETRTLLGDLPWGIGILGFTPPALRKAHLELIQEFKPSAALIAGGRPSQSRALEAMGVPTYLHVPSPELLTLFLKEGARRFIFEGSECGGHVGPSSSLSLWDAQINVLTRSPHLKEIDVLFAGGIHDASSAGLLNAMIGDLAARGARVGVVMGTAYLFTHEAVTSGAISALYQEVALHTDQTVTLHTAPGHATRCAPTPFVDEFERNRAQLAADGVDERTRWEKLEKLNVGRLRVASKGLKRDGDELISVDEDEQRREGMYMLGEVATLRDRVISMRTLHDQVALESGDWLNQRLDALRDFDQRQRQLDPEGYEALQTSGSKTSQHREEIAIIGVASVFPKADDTEKFWENILTQVDTITEVPQERWSIDTYYDPEAPAGQKSTSRWGGFLDALPFDPIRYGIPPQTLAAVEPVQLLALEVAARAIVDAGYDPIPRSETGIRSLPRETTSVIFGAEAGTDLASAHNFRATYPHWVGPLPEALDQALPTLTEDSFAGVLANVISGRIANRLDLGGANFTVDAACASSLAALDAAVKSLTLRESDAVICGGADLHNSINDYLMFSSVHALSKTGRCRTFDQNADGIALGEGVAAVVLKRRSDAQRDGDRIYALISSVAASSDGKALGLTAPRSEGQQRALRRAYQRANINPNEVELIEAHGTGTVVGDRTELNALTEVFQESDAPLRSCSLGSVKSQIGHTKCAAGMAGLIKVTLALYHRTRPPTLHLEHPNAAYQVSESPFTFESQARPWFSREGRRTGALSAFGFGGTNYHAVLREAPTRSRPDRARRIWGAEVIALRGVDLDAAKNLATRLIQALKSRSAHHAPAPMTLRDLALSALTLVEHNQPNTLLTQAALVVSDLSEAHDALQAFITGASHHALIAQRTRQEALTSEQVAFLFPGQGAQKVGMLRELFLTFPQLMNRLSAHPEIAEFIFPPTPDNREEKRAQQAALTDTRYAQPALGICDLAALDVLRALGVNAGHLGGHSYGELVALCAAGVIPEEVLTEISVTRGQMILEATGVATAVTPEPHVESTLSTSGPHTHADPGSMAAIKGSADEVRAALADEPDLADVVLANLNAPDQTVISGPSGQVKLALKALKAQRLRGRELPVACAFHSPLVSSAAAPFQRYLHQKRLRPLPHPKDGPLVWSNQTARPYAPTHGDDPTLSESLGTHLAAPVRFVEQINAMVDAGVELFIEVGPGRILSGLVEQIVGRTEPDDIASDSSVEPTSHVDTVALAPHQGSLKDLLVALARLDCLIEPLDWYALLRPRHARHLTLDQLAAPHSASLLWWVNGLRAWPAQGSIPRHGLKPITAPVKVSVDTKVPNITSSVTTSTSSRSSVTSRSSNSSVTSSLADISPEVAPTNAPSSTLTFAPEIMMNSPQPPKLHQPTSAPSSLSSPSPTDIAPSTSPEVAFATRAYFESMRALAESQERVMLALLRQPLSASLGYPVPSSMTHLMTQTMSQAFSEPHITTSSQTSQQGISLSIAESEAHPTLASSRLSQTPQPLGEPTLDFWGSTTSPLPEVNVPPPTASSVDDGSRNPTQGITLTDVQSLSLASHQQITESIQEEPAQAEVNIGALLTSLVSERTGYPEEMLDAELDLESDLSIDSIKRIEILGALAERLGLAERSEEERDEMIEELAVKRTLGDMITWLEAQLTDSGAKESTKEKPQETAPDEESRTEVTRPKSEGERLPRAVRCWVDAPLNQDQDHTSSTIRETYIEQLVITRDTPTPIVYLFTHLQTLWGSDSSNLDGLIVVAPLPHNPEEALSFGGVSGLIKSAFRESITSSKSLDVRVLLLCEGQDASETLEREKKDFQAQCDGDAPPMLEVIRYHQPDHRQREEYLTQPDLDIPSHTLPSMTPSVSQLDPGDPTPAPHHAEVILVTGGARGVTAHCVRSLARSGITLALCGRTPHPKLAHAVDLKLARRSGDELTLRRLLAETEGIGIKELKRRASTAWAQHEIEVQLETLKQRGAQVIYLSLDLLALSDHLELSVLLDEALKPMELTHHSITGVIHGAGLIDDQRLVDKSIERFQRVYDVKVEGARRLWSTLSHVRRWIFFSSVAAALGNEGQVDYAAANATLDQLAETLDQHPHSEGGHYQARSLQWGPWAGAGMVDETLARLYASRGVRLIELAEGVERFSRAWREVSEASIPTQSTPQDQAEITAGTLAGNNARSNDHSTHLSRIDTPVILYSWPFAVAPDDAN